MSLNLEFIFPIPKKVDFQILIVPKKLNMLHLI